MDVKGHLLATCGWSSFVDPYINVYDLRMNQLLTSVPFPMGPFLLRFHPTISSTVMAVSQLGEFQVLNINNIEHPENSQFYKVYLVHSLLISQIETNGILSFDVSSTGEIAAFGDATGFVSEWVLKSGGKRVNFFSRKLDSLDYAPPAPSIAMNEYRYSLVL